VTPSAIDARSASIDEEVVRADKRRPLVDQLDQVAGQVVVRDQRLVEHTALRADPQVIGVVEPLSALEPDHAGEVPREADALADELAHDHWS